MGSLQFHQQIFMTPMPMPIPIPILAPCNLRTICLRSSCFSSTCSPILCSRIKAVNRVSAVELKQQWLNSLNCPPPPPILEQTEPHNSQSQWVIGIDPDVSGALAVLKCLHLGSSAQVYDSPNVKVLIGNRVRRRMDTKAMVELLRSLSIPTGTTAYIEQSLPYPGDGKQGWWSGGFNYGLWIGVLVASGVSVVPVPSMKWKQEFKLSGNGKTKVARIWLKDGRNYRVSPKSCWNRQVLAGRIGPIRSDYRDCCFRVAACALRASMTSSLAAMAANWVEICSERLPSSLFQDDSRALACSLFPSLSSSLKRKKDHGRAEALLIAAYGKGIRLESDSESLTSINSDNSNSDNSTS